MIQLMIDGKLAALPVGFSFDLTFENPYFTDSSDWTGEVELSPKAAQNIKIFGSVGRYDKSKKQQVYDCTLSDDDTKILVGKATTVEYTPESLNVQLLGGNAMVNYLSQFDDIYLDDQSALNLGNLVASWDLIFPTFPEGANPQQVWEPFARRIFGENGWVMLPCLNEQGSELNNLWRYFPNKDKTGYDYGWPYAEFTNPYEWVLQPKIVYLVRKIVNAMGFTVSSFDAEDTLLARMYFVNVVHTLSLNRMMPHWTVNKFLDEIQNLFGCVFVFNTIDMTCDIKSRARYFGEDIVHLSLVDDDFAVDIEDENTDIANSNLSYNTEDLPLTHLFDNTCYENMQLSDYETTEAAYNALLAGDRNMVARVNGHYYVLHEESEGTTSYTLEEVNHLGSNWDPEKEDEISLSFVPADMGVTLAWTKQLEDGAVHDQGWIPTPSPIGAAPNHEVSNFNIDSYIHTEEDSGESASEDEDVMRIAFYKDWSELSDYDMPVKDYSGQGRLDLTCKTRLWAGWTYQTDDVSYDKQQDMSTVFTDHEKWNPCCALRKLTDYDTIYSLSIASAMVVDTTAPHEIVFYDDIDINTDIRKTFVIHGHKYLCKQIECSVDINGVSKKKTGIFYQID